MELLCEHDIGMRFLVQWSIQGIQTIRAASSVSEGDRSHRTLVERYSERGPMLAKMLEYTYLLIYDRSRSKKQVTWKYR